MKSLSYFPNKLCILLSLFILTACQPNLDNISNIVTLSEENSSGFGGTGNSSSGFGGTGIIGTITEFGSIWVNGIEIGYGNLTTITSDLNSDNRLQLGQQVILETLPKEDKTLTKSIHIYVPIAGKITEKTEKYLIIDHLYRIELTDQTLFDQTISLKSGHYVSVNGYQTGQTNWSATRINPNKNQQHFYHPLPTKMFSNSVKNIIIETSFTQFKLWKNQLKITQLEAITVPKKGQLMVIQGMWQNGVIVPKKMMTYSGFLNHQQQKNSDKRLIPTSKERMPLQQHEIMNMQKEQKGMVQDRMEQMHQQQNLKNQMELQHNMNHPMGRVKN